MGQNLRQWSVRSIKWWVLVLYQSQNTLCCTSKIIINQSQGHDGKDIITELWTFVLLGMNLYQIPNWRSDHHIKNRLFENGLDVKKSEFWYSSTDQLCGFLPDWDVTSMKSEVWTNWIWRSRSNKDFQILLVSRTVLWML